jgi:uncharacterized repeat protein (TIGR02543 family)
MRNKLLSGIGLFLAGIIFLLCTCKELPTNPYEIGDNLKITAFISGGLLAMNAGDSVSIGLIVNIPSLVKKLTVVQGDDQKELTVSLNRPESSQPDTVYFKTMYKLIGKKDITVNAVLGDGTKKTFPVSILVVNATGSLWKQDTMTLVVQEDTTINYSLLTLLKNPSATNVVFTSPDTGVNGTNWKHTISWGAISKDTISLFASSGGSELSELKVFLVVLSKDTAGPQIALVNPSTPEAIVSDSVIVCKFTVTDKLSGVGTIVVKNGTTVLTDTLRSGSTFQCTVSGLKKGEKSTLTIEALDKSIRKNSSILQLQLTYDPLMQDNVKPELRYRLPATGSAAITTPQTSIEIVAVDRNSGIDSVWAFRGTTHLAVVQKDSIYSVMLNNLVAGKTDTVVFKAQDKSAMKNTDSLLVYITYDLSVTDLTGPAIKLSSPAQDRSKVAQSSATLVVICKDENGISVVNYTFGSLNGAMTKNNDSTYSVALANLVKGDNQIAILATDASSKNNAHDTAFTIVYDPTMNDADAPVITLKTPDKDNATVSSKSITIEVVCTDSSGIDTVTCKIGTTDVPVVKGTGGVYSASITTLALGANTFTFTATDKASTKHSSTKAVAVVYDPTMTDNVAPKVVLKNPLNADQRVLNDTVTVQIDCSDDNNISSVTATRGGVAVNGITNAGSLYSVKVTSLTAGKSDTLNFKVVDNSSNKVSKDFPVILRYNRQPTTATLSLPANGATGVIKTGVFKWTDGDDPDDDAVTYTLRYGTSETALSKTIPNITAKTVVLSSELNGATKYYWQVVTYTAVNSDSAVSGIASFTTVEDAPVIMVEPTVQSVVFGNKGTFSVSATGLNLKYQWYKGTEAISGATLSTYTTPAVMASDDGSTYYCAVSNGGGETKTNAVSLIVLYSISYDVNGGNGTAPVDINTYEKEESVVVKVGTGLTKTNYGFSGWTRNGVTNSKVYLANDTLKMGAGNIILDAKWTLNVHTVSFNKNDALASGTMSNQTIAEGSAATLIPNTFVKPGWDFTGWATTASGSVVYKDQVGFDMGSSDVTLYAKWTPKNFTVSFDKNNSDVTTSMSPQTIACGSSVNLNANTFVDGCRTFDGWSTSKTGSVEYTDKASFTMGAQNVTLYAIWKTTPLNISPKLGDTVEVCINDPIILPSCARSYEWHFVSFGGDQIITDLISEFSGAGTNTLKINTTAGMFIYCNITDLDGSIIKTGTWMAGSQWCDY